MAAQDGITVVSIPVRECLHLNSAVTALSHEAAMVIVNRNWINVGAFEGCEIIDVDPAETAAANVLLVGDIVLCALEFPRTRERLETRGIRTIGVAAGELAKAEGGLTCGSILFDGAA